MNVLATRSGGLALPTFVPDGTAGVVRATDGFDVSACGVRAVMVNTLHLASNPGTSALARLGGIHRFMAWPFTVMSDSGGFQVFSLINQSSKRGRVSKDGFSYRLPGSDAKKTLTPEKCIKKQFEIRSDILFCLDYCTHPSADVEVQRQSVDYTVDWARRCKAEFDRHLEGPFTEEHRPLLFAVVQGGADLALRRECAERLLEIGFDGYGFGGWPIDSDGQLVDTVAYVSGLIPDSFPKHALGIGKPENVVAAFRAGYSLFDCVIPTRDARHKRLYVFAPGAPLSGREFYSCVYTDREDHARDSRPIEEGCDCHCCHAYSRAYLRQLFAVNDHLAYRLATIHNLRFYMRLMDLLRAGAPCVPTP